MHVTLATRLNASKHIRGFLARLTRLEAGLYTLVSPSRLFHFDGRSYSAYKRNEYCKPVREWWGAFSVNVPTLLRDLGRYRSVNLTRARADIQLLEVRMHSGTTDYRKIIPWIALWMHIFNVSRYAWRGEPSFGRVLPGRNCNLGVAAAQREDIFRLLSQERIELGADLAEMLWRRRASLRAKWEQVMPRRVAAWERAGWYDKPINRQSIALPVGSPLMLTAGSPAGFRPRRPYADQRGTSRPAVSS